MNKKTKNSGIREMSRNPYLWLIMITSVMFGVLFIRFILGEYAYVYVDMGADTFDINYPLYYLFADVFQGKGYENYMLNVGLGMDMSSYFYQYLNPLNMFVVLLPKSLLPWGILAATYIKLLMISIFGYKLFNKWIGNNWGSFSAALVWTFSSYVMLWGQHYGFCTSIALFTVFLYLVHLHVDDRGKNKNWLLILWITLMLISNYYFLYMSGIIGALYVVVYLFLQKKSFKRVIGKLLGLAGMGILGICIGGVCLIPTLNIFRASTRVAAVNMNGLDWMLKPYSVKWLLTFLSRFLSNNTLGIADEFSGKGNYYEAAMLFTSSLFCVSLPYLLSKKAVRVKTIMLTAGTIVLLLFPITGKIFTMNTHSQRWTFIVCFLEAFAVGMFVKFFIEEQEKKRIVGSVAAGAALAAAAISLVLYGESKNYYEVDISCIRLFAGFLVLYSILLLLGTFVKNFRRVMPVMLLLVLCVELIAANYPAINDRENPTRNQIAMEYYNDGTELVYDELQKMDDSLYRVAKTYESASENDSMAQGYPGFSSYLTTNPKELVAIKKMYGGTGVSDNFVHFGNDNYLLKSLLGMKYMLADPGNILSAQTYAYRNSFGRKDVYENTLALPFGYIYDQKWEYEEVKKMPVIERTLAALHGFYFTEEESETSYTEAGRTEGTEISLLNRVTEAVDCKTEQTAEGIYMSEMTEDPHILLNNVGDVFGSEPVYTITINADVSEKVDMALYYRTKGAESFSQEQIYIFRLRPKKEEWTYTIPGDVTDLRIDVSTKTDAVTIREISVNHCEADNGAFAGLKNSGVSEITYTGNTYRATVENTDVQTKMLCVPFLYSEGWNASVDGEKTKLYSINSGLCGIEIPEGTHEVVLEYRIPLERYGIYLTVGSSVFYLLWLFVSIVVKRRKIRK